MSSHTVLANTPYFLVLFLFSNGMPGKYLLTCKCRSDSFFLNLNLPIGLIQMVMVDIAAGYLEMRL